MKTGTPKRKAPAQKARWGEKLTPEQIKKADAMFAEMDAFWGNRDTGSVDFLIKMRRGEK
jgi:hypothetical protein